MTNDDGLLFICLFAICISWWAIFLDILPFNWVAFLWLSSKYILNIYLNFFLNILNSSPLLSMYFIITFSQFVACLFILLTESFTEQISNIVPLLWASPARLTQNPTLKVLNTQIRAWIRTSQRKITSHAERRSSRLVQKLVLWGDQ